MHIQFNNVFRASDRCQLEKRKTINGEDIIWAMEALGFDQYSQLMKIYLHRFKEVIIILFSIIPYSPDY